MEYEKFLAPAPEFVIDDLIPKRTYQFAQDEIINARHERYMGLLANVRTFLRPVEQLLKVCEEISSTHDGDSGSDRVSQIEAIQYFVEQVTQEHRRHLLRALKGMDPQGDSQWARSITEAVWDVRHNLTRLSAEPLTIDALNDANKLLGYAVLTLHRWIKFFSEHLISKELEGFVSADTLHLEHGISTKRLSSKFGKDHVSTKRAPRGTRDARGRQVRILYNVKEALHYCQPKAKRSKRLTLSLGK